MRPYFVFILTLSRLRRISPSSSSSTVAPDRKCLYAQYCACLLTIDRSVEDFREAISYGVVKVNLDTDMQWAYLSGVRDFVQSKSGYLQTQVGNPDGEDKPNKVRGNAQLERDHR